MAHSWAGYVANAWGADELAPVTRHGYETFCSLGVRFFFLSLLVFFVFSSFFFSRLFLFRGLSLSLSSYFVLSLSFSLDLEPGEGGKKTKQKAKKLLTTFLSSFFETTKTNSKKK